MGFGYSEETLKYVDTTKALENAKEGESGLLRNKLYESTEDYTDFYGIKTINELVQLNAKNYP